jgi:hypothetical protein
MVLFGIGSNPLQIQIEIQPNQNSLQSKTIIPLDHSPNWRVSKNVFMSALSKQTLQNVIRKNNTAVMQVHPHQPVVAEPQFGGMPQQQQLQPIIYAHSETEDVQGVVHLMLPPGKHFEHAGIKIQFVGRIEMVSHFEERVSQLLYPLTITNVSFLHVVLQLSHSHMPSMKASHIMTLYLLQKNFSHLQHYIKHRQPFHFTSGRMIKSLMSHTMVEMLPSSIL